MYVQNSEVFLRTLNFRTLNLDSDSLLKRIWHKKCPRTEHESEWNDIGENDICDNWQIAKILTDIFVLVMRKKEQQKEKET